MGTDLVQVSFGSGGDSRRRQNGDIMAYAIIPDGYTLQKVNKAEKAAVDAYFRHEDTKTLLGNINTPLVVGGLITAFFGVKLADDIITDIETRLGALSEDVKEGIRETVNIKIQAPVVTTPSGKPFRPPSISLEQIIKAIIPGGKE